MSIFRDKKEFEEGLEIALQIKNIIMNPTHSLLIDYTEYYYKFVCDLHEYTKNQEVNEEIKEQVNDLLYLMITIERGKRGDFDDIE